MGKTPKMKNRTPSQHSRAARRATSPTLAGNIDKSLLEIPRASTLRQSNPRHTVLSAHPSGGIAKRPKRGQHTRHQKLRREKGYQKADEFAGKLDMKATNSKEKAKMIKERAKAWDDVNGAATATPANKFGALQDEGADDWEDASDLEEPMRETSEPKIKPSKKEKKAAEVSMPVSAPAEDEIL